MNNKNLILAIIVVLILFLMIFVIVKYPSIKYNNDNNNNVDTNKHSSTENTLISCSLIKSTYPNITKALYLENIDENTNILHS